MKHSSALSRKGRFAHRRRSVSMPYVGSRNLFTPRRFAAGVWVACSGRCSLPPPSGNGQVHALSGETKRW